MTEVLQDFIAIGLVALVGGMASLFLWLVRGGRGRLLPLQRLRPGAWQGREVALVFLFMAFVPAIAQGFLEEIGFFQGFYGKEPAPVQKTLWTKTLASPIIVAGTFLILYSLSRTRPSQLGMTTGRISRNIVLGWLAWFPLTVLTLILFAVVKLWIEAQKHPVEMLGKQSILAEWLLGILVVVVFAAFEEELIFRGVLQGWLQRCSPIGHLVLAGSTLFVSIADFLQQTKEKPVEFNLGAFIFALILIAGYLWVVRMAEGERKKEEMGKQNSLIPSSGMRVRRASAYAAIFGSSMLFAVFHSQVWPTPIPLFFLGLGLGWLAYRTQSLVSSITVHVLFNSVAFLVLGLNVIYGKPNGNAETDAFRPSPAGSKSTMVPGSWWPRFK